MLRMTAILASVLVAVCLGCNGKAEKEVGNGSDDPEGEAVEALIRERGGTGRLMEYFDQSAEAEAAKAGEESEDPPAYFALFDRADSLTHIAPTGQTPGELVKSYGPQVKQGNRKAAVDALVVVASIIGKEGGLFDKSLAELADDALAVSSSDAFVGLLWASIPNECAFTSSENDDGIADAGYSSMVLQRHRALAERVWQGDFAARAAKLPPEKRRLCQEIRKSNVTGNYDEP